MRAFIAVEISGAARDAVARLQERMKAAGADVSWVKPENLHLTLKFLGEIGEERVQGLVETLSSSLHLPPFTFALEGAGAFPRPERPKVLWAGINEGKEALLQLAREVEAVCGRCGFPAEERPFSPHLTIGRVRSPRGLDRLAKELQGTAFQGGKTEAREIILFQSVLSPYGPAYTPLAELPLRAGG